MLREMADLGFEYAELSHGIRITLVPGILKAVEEGVIKISSVHNFCPLPTGITRAAPNLFEPSASTHREHDQWLRHTKHNLDFAEQVGAKAMVTHLGSVGFFWSNPSAKLRQWVRNHPNVQVPEDPAYQKVLTKCCVTLRKRMPPYWKQVKASLDEIRTYALDKNVSIGCENREKFSELPVDDDFPQMFEDLTGPNMCGYWHDTGHAQLKQEMGMVQHRRLLEQSADRILGFHLHDVNAEGDDHQPIGSGHIDFEMVSSFWRPEHLLTMEFSPALKVDEVRASKVRVEALLEKRFG